jgi:hypothetical protein
MYTVSHIRPDRTAEIVIDRCRSLPAAATLVSVRAYRISYTDLTRAQTFGNELMAAFTRANAALSEGGDRVGAELVYADSGHVFRIDPFEFPPSVCPCCFGLVRPGDHAYAGDEDAYCLGCHTWDDSVESCLPANSAHPDPWSVIAKDAIWCMEITFEPAEGETDSEFRYSAHPDAHTIWSDETNACIAMPGLTSEQILGIDITRIVDR